MDVRWKSIRKPVIRRQFVRKPVLWMAAFCATVLLVGFDAAAQMAPAIAPGPNVHLDYSYYPVEGRDATEVLHSLRRSGPRSEGETYFGITRSQTGFAYQLVSNASGCVVESLGVRTDIVITLPVWKPPHNAAQELLDQWEGFMAKLSEHELWHAEASSRGTREVYESVKDMRARSCSELDRKAKAEANRISEAVEQRNREYDRLTDHGRKNGIVWHY